MNNLFKLNCHQIYIEINLSSMVKYFHFQRYNTSTRKKITFNGILQSTQCTELIAGGKRQCTKRCQMGIDFCWIHLLDRKKLRYKQSTIKDTSGNFIKGLFASQNNEDGEIVFAYDRNNLNIICDYNSELIDGNELNHRYGLHNTGPYSAKIKRKKHNPIFEDGALRRGVGSLINHSDDPNLVNCEILQYENRNLLCIANTKDIKNNTELFLNYGPDYILHEKNTKYSTNYKRKTL
jgi:hypothetical protein